MQRRIIQILLALVLVAAIVGAIIYTKLGQFQSMGEAAAAMQPPPTTVNAATVEATTWEQTLTSTGTLTPVQGVTVSAEVAGRVTRISFNAGDRVDAGTTLVELDTDAENAQLKAAMANAALARSNLNRSRRLGRGQLISRAEVDRAAAEFKAAQAQVGIMRATLARKTIKAPFGGRLGLRQINLGQILRVGDPVVSLQTLDPIHADFSLPQQYLGNLQPDMTVRLSTDAAPGKTFTGRLLAVSPEVDPLTRNLRVQAEFSNPDDLLRAGMFVSIEVVLPKRTPVLVIPATAVQFAPFGDSVFVIVDSNGDKAPVPNEQAVSAQGKINSGSSEGDKAQILKQQFVQLGQSRGDFIAVTKGLAAGDVVVSAGGFKMRSGMPVVIDNTLAPKPQLNPKPANS